MRAVLSPANKARLKQVRQVWMTRQNADGVAVLAAGATRDGAGEGPDGAVLVLVDRHLHGLGLGDLTHGVNRAVKELDLHIAGNEVAKLNTRLDREFPADAHGIGTARLHGFHLDLRPGVAHAVAPP